MVIRRNRLTILFWDPLFDALMRSGLIEVLHLIAASAEQSKAKEDAIALRTYLGRYRLLVQRWLSMLSCAA
jgi:hypothetical protein